MAAKTSARLVIDFDPGSKTVACTGRSAYGVNQPLVTDPTADSSESHTREEWAT